MILTPPKKVPMELPILANMTTKRILVILFFQSPFIVFKSSAIFSESLTVGLRIWASTSPANHPAAKAGFREVMGATKNAVRMVSGCAKQMMHPNAAKVLL